MKTSGRVRTCENERDFCHGKELEVNEWEGGEGADSLAPWSMDNE